SGTVSNAAGIWVDKIGCPDETLPCNVIHVRGEILKDDWKVFKTVAFSLKGEKAVVELRSPGGLLDDGIRIGTGISVLGYDTFVPDAADCVSMCAAMWLAGKTRYAASNASVGFHQTWVKNRQGNVLPSASGNKLLRDYYKQIGIPKPAIDFFTSASPDDA